MSFYRLLFKSIGMFLCVLVLMCMWLSMFGCAPMGTTNLKSDKATIHDSFTAEMTYQAAYRRLVATIPNCFSSALQVQTNLYTDINQGELTVFGGGYGTFMTVELRQAGPTRTAIDVYVYSDDWAKNFFPKIRTSILETGSEVCGVTT